MKDYKLGIIYCRCSARMSCRGKVLKIYETTPVKVRCPNCHKLRRVYIAVLRKHKKKPTVKQIARAIRNLLKGKRHVDSP